MCFSDLCTALDADEGVLRAGCIFAAETGQQHLGSAVVARRSCTASASGTSAAVFIRFRRKACAHHETMGSLRKSHRAARSPFHRLRRRLFPGPTLLHPTRLRSPKAQRVPLRERQSTLVASASRPVPRWPPSAPQVLPPPYPESARAPSRSRVCDASRVDRACTHSRNCTRRRPTRSGNSCAR